jgi:CDP-4-dehydro-6-deoxyglucose reductase, E1
VTAAALRAQILSLVEQYHAAAASDRPFTAGESEVPVSGRVIDEADLVALVEASLDGWLTTGRFAARFADEFARFLGRRWTLLCNSGSSANLLAVSALTSPALGERRLREGDEVITVAAAFPTTVNPIVQQRLVPVFVDIELGTYNVDAAQLREAVGPRTRAIVLAHTLGNPFDVDAVRAVATRHDLWLIEDNCDALGSRYRGELTGTFGDLATHSFYPAHHITTGEGGAVVTDRPILKRIVESFRDWGRDCWCEPGCDDTCGKRFEWQIGTLPCGYDHKYTYAHLGYNLKLTDMQAAVGTSQLSKLPGFIEQRRRNWMVLRQELQQFEDVLVLPQATSNSDPSWFGFPISVRPEAPFSRKQLTGFLESRRIGTRLLFGGNLLRQPAYDGVVRRVAGCLERTDYVMERTFWIGVYPGLSTAALEHVVESFRIFFTATASKSMTFNRAGTMATATCGSNRNAAYRQD